MDTPFLELLERAELAAADARRAARAQADRRLREAQAEARAIEAAGPGMTAAAVAAHREQVLAAARREMAALERELGELDETSVGAGASSAARFERAVELVVGAVLCETSGG